MSAGQIAGGVVGGGIGFLVGGPAGAAVGFGLGLGLGSMSGGGQKGAKPNINTDPGQTSTYGAFITRTHGTIGQSGNIIWLEKNKLKAKVKKAKKSGKGGGAPAAAATVTYFATFAVGLCKGPIAGVRRIWVGPNLVYYAGSDDLESIIASNKALKNFKIYLGTDTQTPNSRIQADRGAANTPAYSGLAYIVVTDLALAEYGNSIQGAQIKVEVVNRMSTGPAVQIEHGFAGTPYPQGNTDSSCASAYMMGSSLESYVNICKSGGTHGNLIYEIALTQKANRIAAEPGVVSSSYANTTYPLAGDSDHKSVGFGRAASVIIDGVVFEVPYFGYYPGTCRYVKRGMLIWLITMSSPARVDCLTSGAYYTDGSARHITSDGTFLYVLLSDGKIEKRDGESLEIVSTHDCGLPSTGWQSGYTGNIDGIMFREERLYILRAVDSSIYQIADFEIKAIYTLPFTPAIKNSSWGIGSGSVAFLDGSTAQVTYYRLSQEDSQLIPLSEIVESEALRSNIIAANDIDVSAMDGSVIGYRVTAAGSIRSALEPLRAAYPFDAYQSGYKIRFRSRGTGSVVTIPIGHLIADTQLEESREMDSQLPQRVTVQYLDRERDYDQNEQSEERLGAESVDEQSVSIQVVMTAAHAKQTAEKLLYLAWLERNSYNFKLPPIYSGLESSDVITIAAEFASYELRLVSASPNSDGVISCSGVPSNSATYASVATADAGQQAPATIPLAGASVAVLLDIPVVDEAVQNAPGFVAVMTGYTGGWAGGTIVRSTDAGQTWEDVQGFGEKGTFGYAQAPLGAHAGNLVQRGGSLTVSLLSGFVDGVTEAQMFGGSNTAAYGAHGRWEIIRFQNAALNADGSYTLDTFWRGDKGTEWATGLHQSGDLFVLLNDPDNAFISMSQDSIGQPRTYRAVTFGADIDSASDMAMTYTGVNLECLSPCHPSSSRDGSGNLTANWVRRTRVGGAWRDYVDASLGETSEAYEVDVMSGSTVKRTLTSSAQSVIYSAADQVTDFGSAQSSITLRVYQLSSVVGRGYPLEATF